jgi:hypothetical protein
MKRLQGAKPLAGHTHLLVWVFLGALLDSCGSSGPSQEEIQAQQQQRAAERQAVETERLARQQAAERQEQEVKESAERQEAERLNSIQTLYPNGDPFWLQCDYYKSSNSFLYSGRFGSRDENKEPDIFYIDPAKKTLQDYNAKHGELHERRSGELRFTPTAIEWDLLDHLTTMDVLRSQRIDRRYLTIETNSSTAWTDETKGDYDKTNSLGKCHAIQAPQERGRAF